jgi:hypothetical protein
MFRLEGSDRYNFFYFHDSGFRSHGHNGIKIPGRQSIGQISKLISFVRFDECVVGMDGRFQNAALVINDAFFFACGYFRSDADSGVKAQKSGGRGAHAFAQNALRHQLQRDFLRGEPLLKIICMRAGKRSDDVADLTVLEHQSEFAVASATIIADRGDVFSSFAGQCLNEVVGEARTAKSAKHNARAVGNVCYRSIDAGENFLPHESIGVLNFKLVLE